ncbi:type IV pilus assembly protein FimV [Psychrobacter vallis]|uniref:type IV pilus assembly protein FimV n=1 Tax=Psychrobacter vallis TaxID=248451 RepID=UPI00191A2269|nr:peptigoglycan-binding protein LysM [Psychrobacter vallis]
MSCHFSHRLTTVHRAISMALLCSVGYATLASTAQAATIGKTVVTSAQHEPLAASIVVTNIRSADFSASLANPIIYQQMGLTPTDSMMVSFRPTSATSGQVFITTSKPVSKPFADVVLAIEDNGQRNVIPKTLLMPLDTSLPIAMPKDIVTGAKKPNLPSVSANNAKPLTVREGAPPPLMAVSQSSSTPKSSTPKSSTPKSSTSELIASRLPAPSINTSGIQAPTVTTTSQNNNLTYASSRLDNGRLNNAKNIGTINIGSNTTQNTANNVMGNKTITNDAATLRDKAMLTENNKPKTAIITDKQLDILNIQVTRQIQPSSQVDVGMMAASPTIPTPNNNSTNVLNPHTNTSTATAATSNVTANAVASTAPSTVKNTAVSANKATNSTTAQYQVQRNDSLWVIAQQIAQENNLDIQTVMKEIQSQNPDAFINKDAGQLKADAKLSLPSYDVLPSQNNLEAAISAQRQYSRRANTPVATKTAKTSIKKSSETTQAAKVREKPTVTKTQTLPKAQFSVLAPDNNGSAEGTQVKSAATTGNGLSTDILATLKASRQSTASQAQRLSKTSSALDSYTKKIQLQNQKLAELQARLKKLRNQ